MKWTLDNFRRMPWDFDLCWRRWAVGVEWGEGYFLFILGPMTFERWWDER